MTGTQPRVHSLFKVKAGGRTRLVVFDTQDLSLGRAPENDLAIDDAEMSRKHAIFRRTPEGVRVEDQGTSNGTGVNGECVDHAMLEHGDVIRIGEVEITYGETTRNPASLGGVEYASQLKSFASPLAGDATGGDGEATILGLVDPVGGDDEPFEVRPARDFDFGLHDEAPAAKAPRDLDAELAGLGDDLGETAVPAKRAPALAPAPTAAEPWTLDDDDGLGAQTPAARGPLSVTLEIDGLSGDQRRMVEGWVGKTLQLAGLRVRVKGRDLG